MKKIICFLLVTLLLLTGCGKKLEDIPALEQIKENGESWALEQLEGYTAENLETVWGAAPWMEHATGGYVWRIPGDWDEVEINFEGEKNEISFVSYSHVMKAEILEINENQVVVKPAEGEWEATSSDQIVVNLAKAQKFGSATYTVGDVVLVRHHGMIEEIYPAQFAGLCQVLPLDQADNWHSQKVSG